MQGVIDFFEYTLSGGIWFIYFILMIILSLACLGVVGDKVSKRRRTELMARREALAKVESDKAKDIIKKQVDSYGVNNVLDPTINKSQEVVLPSQTVPEVVQEPVPEVIDLDLPATNVEQNVDNVTPIVDDDVKSEEATPVLVINDDGTSNVSI